MDTITEPEAACAYYVSSYADRIGDFEGHILIIDFGGGTLDISLCEVKRGDGKPNIVVKLPDGEGRNGPNRIGTAGFAFMEAVTRLALKRMGVPEDVVDADPNALQQSIYAVERIFQEFARVDADA